MTEKVVLARLLMRGSLLDSYASHASSVLATAVPELAEQLHRNEADERRHARMQFQAARDLDGDSRHDDWGWALFQSWRHREALWQAVMLNLVEWKAKVNFKVLGRRCRDLGLHESSHVFLEIATDEERHVRTGWETIARLGGVNTHLVDQVARTVYSVESGDELLEVVAPRVLRVGSTARATFPLAEKLKERVC